MRENFALACGFVLKHEGGYSNDPDDPGGETNFGISKRYHPNVDIKALTDRDAAEIYLKEYWLPTCDILSFPNDMVYFDTFVNMGRDAADKCMDGTSSFEEFLFNRIELYIYKVKAKPVKMKYIFGWLIRCLELYQTIKSEQKRKRG